MQKLNGKWLVGISAGSDSMALLNMCYELKMDIIAAHVNYHHRKEADEEERYVVSFCKERNIEILVLNEPFKYIGNFEAEARKYRYDFFSKIVKERKLKGVLVAHHQDDLLETYFMQEEKGSIPSFYGLKEEMIYDGVLVKRPLLNICKKDLMDYCDKKGIQYYTDITNFDESLTRNRIRHQVVEKMSSFEREMVLKEIQYKNAERQERSCRIDAWIKNEELNLPFYRSLNEIDQLELLRKLLEKIDPIISLAHLQEINHVLNTQDDFMIPIKRKYIVQDNTKIFLIEKAHAYCDTFETIESVLDNRHHPYYEAEEGKCGVFALSVNEDDFPLCIRSYKEGDVIQMRYGKKKVHRFFIDRHIPLYRRITWPVVENKNGDVIFVSGLGCDVAHYTIKPSFNVVEYFLLSKGENDRCGKKMISKK